MKLFRYFPLLLLGLLACSQSNVDPDTTVPPVGTPTEVGQPTGNSVSQTIGSSGGIITTPDGALTLTFPAGALTKETTITVQKIENKAPGGTGQAYRFGPDGTTFAKSVQLTWHYTEADLAGSTPEALGIAFQEKDGTWLGNSKVSVNQTARTVTAELPHFSDWTFFEQFFMTPTERVLSPGETVQVDVFYQPGRREGDSPEALLTPLVTPWKLDRKYVKNWRVNGKDLNGQYESSLGALSVLNDGASANYQAPAQVPAVNPVAVSVELALPGGPQVQLVSNFNIQLENEFSVNGQNIKTPIVSLTLAKPFLSILLTESFVPAEHQISLNAATMEFTGPGEYSTDKEINNSQMTTISAKASDGITYTDSYVDQYGVEHKSHAKLNIQEYDSAKQMVRGRISGSLYYFNQDTYQLKTIGVNGTFKAAVPM